MTKPVVHPPESAITAMPAGTAGQVLTATGTAPTWQAVQFPAINTLTAGEVGLADQIAEYNATASANRTVTVQKLGGYIEPGVCNARLSLSLIRWDALDALYAPG